jgi:hypothetical protein
MTQNIYESVAADALRPFGWTCTEDFWRRYYSDPWVFSLVNAVERLTAENARLLARYEAEVAANLEVLEAGAQIADWLESLSEEIDESEASTAISVAKVLILWHNAVQRKEIS